LRRIGILSAVAVCIGAVVGRRRRRGTAPIVVVQESADAVVEPLNGATATPERSIRI
jgi:hypothetical protein